MIRKSPSIALGLALLLVSLVGSPAASARVAQRAGTLVRPFGEGGYVVRDFGSEPGAGGAKQVLLQTDGRALVRTDGGQIGRLLLNGSVDPSFGEGGYLTHLNAAQMALAADGRILAAGATGSPSATATVSRFLSDGSPDPSFGSGGSVTLDFSPEIGGSPRGLVSLADGGVLLVTSVGREAPGVSFLVVKLLPDGRIDPSYGHGGRATVPLPASSGSPEHPGIALDGDRLCMVVSGGQADLFIARLLPDGTPDPSLGGSGTLTTKLMEGGGYNLAIQSDGRMVVSNDGSRIARFMSDGSPDPSFGEGGFVIVPALQKATREHALGLQPDGRILLGGYLEAQPDWKPQDFRLARLMPDGTLDPSFGEEGTGFVTTDMAGGSEDEGESLALAADGRVLLAGRSTPTGAIFTRAVIAMARYTPDGVLDPAYGHGGIALQRPSQRSSDRVAAMFADGEGRVTVTGRAGGRVLVARYRRDGSPDPTFGVGGETTEAPVDAYFGEEGASISSYPGHRTLVGTASGEGAALLMYGPGGGPDPSFGERGVVRSPHLDRIVDIAVAEDGDILVAGYSAEPCGAFIEAFEPDGSPEVGFGDGGAVQVGGVISGVCRSFDLHLALRASGRILLAGETNFRELREYSARGREAKGFASSKKTREALPRRIGSISVDRRGRVLLGGSERGRFAVVRLNPHGTVDRAFGRRGRAVRRVGFARASVGDVELGRDGRIVVAGRVYPSRSSGYWEMTPAVVRFTPAGRVDRSFGRKGAWVGPSTAVVGSVAIVPHGIVAGGWHLGDEFDKDLFLLALRR